MNTKLKIVIIVFVIITIGAIVYGIKESRPAKASYDDFAKCLTEKQAIMYGSASCSVCQKQKSEFGDSFQYVNYVECTENPEACNSEKIERVPTWKFSDGEKIVGFQTFETLSQKTSCPLPNTQK